MKQMCSHELSICHRHCQVTLCTHPRSWWCVVELSDDGCRRRLLYSSSLSTPTHYRIVRVMVEHHSCGAGWEVLRALRHPAQLTAVVFERESGRTMIVLEQESFKIPKKILKLQGVNLKSEGLNLSSEGANLYAFCRPPILPPEPSRNRHLWKK